MKISQLSKLRQKKSVTLLELLIAISLLFVVLSGLTSIDLFSRNQVLTSDRRIKLQNEVSYTLEHMSKNIARAIGGKGTSIIDRVAISGDSAIKVRIDSNFPYGQLDPGDIQIAYRYNLSSHQIWYYKDWTNSSDSYEILAPHISSDFSNDFVIYDSANNFIDITIVSCWDPAQATCGEPDNPSIKMRTRVKMPSISTN